MCLIKLMKGKALRKPRLHGKTAASVLLKLFISGNESENETYTGILLKTGMFKCLIWYIYLLTNANHFKDTKLLVLKWRFTYGVVMKRNKLINVINWCYIKRNPTVIYNQHGEVLFETYSTDVIKCTQF